ncbi:Tim44 domain-containing protein [Motiliproteus sp. MSK22-1]|uniref:Tim44 domain-containing protein n=1 Tax=Motiliproteus sp. MSK22-1 TaxID=1897630 RepID=UPI000976B725|nr:Tim44-like domain-containing protein [Motiliproteus sp. MSK22-1]OMH38199.1 hypothetical protein BGP75_08065 [Motiliproteus sp. MSK22-1]
MMRLLSFCCALLIGMTFTLDHAEAKRFGGGGSFGKMFSTPKKVAPAPKSTTPNAGKSATQTPNAATKPRSGLMGGMLGGLLAGGLLGALFFGGAFDGIQMMDILIIGVICFVLFRLFARMKQSQQQPQYAGGYRPEDTQQAREQAPETQRPQAFEPTPLMSNGLANEELELPSWFNKEAFLSGARQHFESLQTAWNRNDLEEIRTYCDAELFANLESERKKLGEGTLDNEVVSVMAELLGFKQREDTAELSVNFYGWMREGTEAQTTEFSEIWHLTRDLSTEGSDWFIVGIEQP